MCGNGTKECAEGCDAGSANGTPGSSCSKECVVDKCLDAPETVKALCGNGVKDCNEQCDDGNNVNGDNCDENCKIEDICEGVVPPAITVGGYGWVDNICLKGRFDNEGINYTYSIIYNDLNSAYAAEGHEVGKDYAKEFNDIAVSKTRGRNLYLINDVKYLNSTIDPSKICYTCAYIRTGGCFAPETLIQLADGTEVTVADLHAGDEILNPTTKKIVKVKSFIESYEDKPLVEITYLGKTLRVTDGHPMVTSKGIVKAITLKAGDILFDKSGKEVVIEKVQLGELDPSQRVINLIIESEEPSIENHILVSEGVQTGDYIAQKIIAKD